MIYCLMWTHLQQLGRSLKHWTCCTIFKHWCHCMHCTPAQDAGWILAVPKRFQFQFASFLFNDSSERVVLVLVAPFVNLRGLCVCRQPPVLTAQKSTKSTPLREIYSRSPPSLLWWLLGGMPVSTTLKVAAAGFALTRLVFPDSNLF